MSTHEFTISIAAANDYKECLEEMVKKVNIKMTEKNNVMHLIGDNPLSVMYDNHHNHALFMYNTFKLNDITMLKKTISWVLSSYLSRGFSPLYFKEVLSVWIAVVKETLDAGSAQEIILVYEKMLGMISSHEEEKSSLSEEPVIYQESAQKLLTFLLSGNHKGALSFLKGFVKDKNSLRAAYVHLIQPVMYEIGNLWEKNKITVSHEHLATSIIMRLMSSFYEDYVLTDSYKSKIIISATFNEFHEIGARIVSDFLEMDGFDVKYLGADLPKEALIKILEEEKPDILGLSVSMSYNIENVLETVIDIKKSEKLKKMKIMMGGYALSYVKENKIPITIDKILKNAEDAVSICNEWWSQ